jgi:hypothetical protein
MSIDTSEDADIDIDNNLDSGIADFEIAGSSTNKKAKNNQYHVKEKLNSINEKRSLDRQLNSFSDYWEF